MRTQLPAEELLWVIRTTTYQDMSGMIIPIFRLPGIHDSVSNDTHKNTQNWYEIPSITDESGTSPNIDGLGQFWNPRTRLVGGRHA